jgi:hypothetical protein
MAGVFSFLHQAAGTFEYLSEAVIAQLNGECPPGETEVIDQPFAKLCIRRSRGFG